MPTGFSCKNDVMEMEFLRENHGICPRYRKDSSKVWILRII